MSTDRTLLSIRLVLWLTPLALLAWIANENLLVSGAVTLRCTVDGCDPQLENFASKDRELLTGRRRDDLERYRVLTADPLYVDAESFRTVSGARVKLTFQPSSGSQRLRLGVYTRGSQYQYYDLADANAELLEAESTMNAVREDGLTLFQRSAGGQRQFFSIDEFLNNLPDRKTVAQYHSDIPLRLNLSDYRPSQATTDVDISARGSHTLTTYVGRDEPLELELTLQDINRHAGRDDVTIRVVRGEETIRTSVLRDDGVVRATGQASPERTIELQYPDLDPGVYQVEISTRDDDPFLRRISTKQRYLMFKRRLYIAGNDEYESLGRVDPGSRIVYVRGSTLTASTSHQGALQTMTVGRQSLTLSRVNAPVTLTLPKTDGLIAVTVPNQDVLLETDGYFALSPDAFLEIPSLVVHSLEAGDDWSDYDYVLARYHPTQQAGSWTVAELDLQEIPKSKTAHFVIVGSPAIGAGGHPLRVKSLEIELRADPLIPIQLFRMVKNYLSRVAN